MTTLTGLSTSRPIQVGPSGDDRKLGMPQNRVPTAILKAKGSFLKHPERKRERDGEATPAGPLGEPHSDLSREQKAVWRELAGQLLPGVAGNSDRLAFRKLVCLETKSRQGYTKGNEEQLILSYLVKFGLTPADRSRVTVVAEESKKDDPLSRLMAQSPNLPPKLQ